MFKGFREKDFAIFLEPEQAARVDYIRDHLHPRLRDLGTELAGHLSRSVDVALRCQIRSGHWHKNPWATWISIISVEEKIRSDPKRPRLGVFLDHREALVGYLQSIWQPRWKELVEGFPPLAELTDDTAREGKLQIAIGHWIRPKEEGAEWERETIRYRTAKAALKAASRLGQDFFLLGRTYPWPDRKDLLCSSAFTAEARSVLEAAWPLYHLAFLQDYVRPTRRRMRLLAGRT
jgi:uncharacterized protein YktB (UPF0637 family)